MLHRQAHLFGGQGFTRRKLINKLSKHPHILGTLAAGLKLKPIVLPASGPATMPSLPRKVGHPVTFPLQSVSEL